MPTATDNNNKPSILKNTRESKGLTLEIVHEATKIPMDALKAIEEGYSSRILSPFYYKGFIKIYSEFLGLDVAEMYKQYGVDQPTKVTVPQVTGPVRKPAVPITPSAPKENQPNAALEQMQEWASSVFTPRNLQAGGKILGFVILLIVLVKMAGCAASLIMHHKKAAVKHQSVRMQQVQEERKAARESRDEEKPAAAAPAPVKRDMVQAQAQNDRVEVAVRATKDTWLQVKSDDKVVFQMTLSKGSMETWTADNRIQLAGRDIEQLDMEVNGKHVGTLGGGERRIRRVWITKEGLTVKK